VNRNTQLDSGDVVRVLRAVVGLDPQPQTKAAFGATPAARSGGSTQTKLDGPGGLFLTSPTGFRGNSGERVTVRVNLDGLPIPVAAASFVLEYPTNALRLLGRESHRTGSMVPASAVTMWHVKSAGGDYASQSGRVAVGISSPTAWATNGGVLAEFTFEIQPGQTERYGWPLRVSAAEIAPDSFDLLTLADRETLFIGRDPLPLIIQPGSLGFVPEGFGCAMQGEMDVPYVIEVSSDMVHWTALGTLQSATGALQFVDREASNSGQRFYRARQL
jgi:hypothetical protein